MYACGGMYIVCTYVFVCHHVCLVAGTAFQTRSDDPNLVTGDSDLYPFWTRCNGGLKIDLWDDP